MPRGDDTEVRLVRFGEYGGATIGMLGVDGFPQFASLEPPNKYPNKPSCIPPGDYRMVLEYSPKFRRELWEVKHVPGFSEVKIHAGNHLRDTQACPLVGLSVVRLADGPPMLISSQSALERFHALLAGLKSCWLIVR